MQIQAQIGPVATSSSLSAGQLAPVRQGNMGDLIASELHGRYYEATYRQSLFAGAVVGTTTVAGAITAITGGLVLTNPIGSGVNIVLNKFGFAFYVAFPAAAAVGLAAGFNGGTAVTQTTPVTPRSQFVGIGASGKGLLASAVTLPTAPNIVGIYASGLTGAITTAPFIQSIVDLEGSIILPPGGYVLPYTSTVSGTSGAAFSFSWEEVPL